MQGTPAEQPGHDGRSFGRSVGKAGQPPVVGHAVGTVVYLSGWMPKTAGLRLLRDMCSDRAPALRIELLGARPDRTFAGARDPISGFIQSGDPGRHRIDELGGRR